MTAPLTDVLAALRSLVQRLQAENARLQRVLDLSPCEAQPPGPTQLRRLVIGEAVRFPDLGRTFYERGPERMIEALAALFTQLAKRGVLDIDDPHLAAAQFNWLVMSIPLNQAMLLGTDKPASPYELDSYADTGVRAFVRACVPR